MATMTEHLRLKKPDESDYYDVQDQNANMDKLDAACVISENVRSLRVLTQAAFDALSVKQSSVLYIVTGEKETRMYLGSSSIGGSDTPGMAHEFTIVYTRGITGAIVKLEEASE